MSHHNWKKRLKAAKSVFQRWHTHCSRASVSHKAHETKTKGVDMKKLIFVMTAMLAFGSVAMAKEKSDGGQSNHEQVVGVNDAFIPSGFDSASDAFVVVSGIFPSGCYQWKTAKVDHVGPALHEVRAVANVFEGLCIMVMVPFQKEVQLGKLAAGDHAIRFVNGDGTYFEKHLNIEQ